MLQTYRQHTAERAALGIPPLPLDAPQTAALIELIKAPPTGEERFLIVACSRNLGPLLASTGSFSEREGVVQAMDEGAGQALGGTSKPGR